MSGWGLGHETREWVGLGHETLEWVGSGPQDYLVPNPIPVGLALGKVKGGPN